MSFGTPDLRLLADIFSALNLVFFRRILIILLAPLTVKFLSDPNRKTGPALSQMLAVFCAEASCSSKQTGHSRGSSNLNSTTLSPPATRVLVSLTCNVMLLLPPFSSVAVVTSSQVKSKN